MPWRDMFYSTMMQLSMLDECAFPFLIIFSVMLSVPTTLSIVHHVIAYLGKANQGLGYFFGRWTLAIIIEHHMYIYIYM